MKGVSNKLKQYKTSLPSLTIEQTEALIGMMLGDISIQQRTIQSGTRIKFELGAKNKEYAYHLYGLFKLWILTPPKEQIRVNAKGNIVKTIVFQTITHKT